MHMLHIYVYIYIYIHNINARARTHTHTQVDSSTFGGGLTAQNRKAEILKSHRPRLISYSKFLMRH